MAPDELLTWFDRSTGITTDSRQCRPGQLYFALKGERFDGHAFVEQALQDGCLAAVVDQEGMEGEGLLCVPDVLRALQDLARLHRDRFQGPVIGLTGSNGKTTTKELLCAVLSARYRVHATKGNLNNHIGVPLTLLELPLDAELALIEMGANHQGEIALLSSIADPTHGFITNVGMAHLEGFGGVEGVKKGKQELYVHLANKEGTAWVPALDADLVSLSELPGLKRAFFGTDDHPPVVWRKGPDPNSPLFWSMESSGQPGPWHTDGQPLHVALEGEHHLANLRAAIAVGVHFDVPATGILSALANFQPPSQRGETVSTEENTVIVDCYNANPSSVESSLRAFAAAAHPSPLVILGDMMELGDHVAEGHRLVREVALGCGLECWTVGTLFAQHAKGDLHFPSTEALSSELKAMAPAGRTILLKGSRSMRLEALVPHL